MGSRGLCEAILVSWGAPRRVLRVSGELLGAPGGALGVRLGALGVDFGDFLLSGEAPGARSELFRKSSSRVHGSIDFEVEK